MRTAAPPVSIRDARESDLPRIVSIYNEAIPGRRATADTEPVSVVSRQPWFHEHTPDRRPLWVAERDGLVVGWLSFQSFYGRPAYAATAEVSVYVGGEAQRGGVARRLLARAIERAPGLGLATLVAFVFGHNEPSVRLFEAHGFTRWGHLPRVARLDGREADLLILGRRVD
ncbi:MAG TPA: GNAT family N-acetyltransferase [Methylomirabilota bacterium]|nr:GNAT family N-acetyltransferase [Methylomirabilota bacterium]